MKFAVPRGTSDILPDSIPLWEELESKARKICKSYGYREIRTPVYEDIDLFKRSLGPTSDVVNKQLLELASGKEDGGCALRPEGTASVVRSYIENSLDGKESLSKLFYLGPMFRGERPQKGRLRQFHQIGVEAIGPNSTSPFLDAEVIALAMHLLKGSGIKDPQLRINSLGSKEDKANISAWLRGEFAKHKKDLCEDCQGRFERNVFRVLDCKKEGCRKAAALVVKNLPLSPESQNYFNEVQAALKSAGIAFEVSPHLVRGLDYYTHTVFEITAEGLGSQDAVGAGGRYGGLVHELGGNENVGGVGFALGMERILLACGKPAAVTSGVDVFVIAMKEEYQPQAFLLLQQMRQAAICADMNFTVGSMKSQMGRANKANARFALILGEEEIKNHTVALKDMQAGTQETVEVENIVSSLKDKLQRVARN
jgi:histidyl-tRNA synthetase